LCGKLVDQKFQEKIKDPLIRTEFNVENRLLEPDL
jgi:hypothetical protein